MHYRCTKRGAALTLAALLPALNGCYEYAPLATSNPPAGETVALEITDQGRVSLSDRFGPGVAEIVGRVVSQQDNQLVINVYRVSQVGGASALWSGETSRLDRSFIGSIKQRQVSATRTTILVAGSAAVLAALLLNRNLIGGFSGRTADPDPGPGPVQVRIPLPLPR